MTEEERGSLVGSVVEASGIVRGMTRIDGAVYQRLHPELFQNFGIITNSALAALRPSVSPGASLQCFHTLSHVLNVCKCSLMRFLIRVSFCTSTHRRRVVRGVFAARTADAWTLHHREIIELRSGATSASHESVPPLHSTVFRMKAHSTSALI